jgi:hypothetical protein
VVDVRRHRAQFLKMREEGSTTHALQQAVSLQLSRERDVVDRFPSRNSASPGFALRGVAVPIGVATKGGARGGRWSQRWERRGDWSGPLIGRIEAVAGPQTDRHGRVESTPAALT